MADESNLAKGLDLVIKDVETLKKQAAERVSANVGAVVEQVSKDVADAHGAIKTVAKDAKALVDEVKATGAAHYAELKGFIDDLRDQLGGALKQNANLKAQLRAKEGKPNA